MALFKILKGNKTNLKSKGIVNGYCYVTLDEGKMYIDHEDENTGVKSRFCLNAAEADLAKGKNYNIDFTNMQPYDFSFPKENSVLYGYIVYNGIKSLCETYHKFDFIEIIYQIIKVPKINMMSLDKYNMLGYDEYYRCAGDEGSWTSWELCDPPFSATGDATTPVYINSLGVPTTCKYQLNETVPKDAVFTDTTYGVATSSTLGLIKSGNDITVNSDGDVTVDKINTILMSVDGSTTDVNTLKEAKKFRFYNLSSNGTYTNLPAGVQNRGIRSGIMSYPLSGSSQVQEAIFNNSKKYYRYSNGESWYDWRLVCSMTPNTAVGSSTQPIYMTADGVPLACSYQLNKTVPKDAKFTDTTYSAATTTTAGLMSAADKTKLDGIAAGANKYSLPLASSSTRGGVKIGYTQSGKNYPVQLSSEKMYVNVPWTDTTYTFTNKNVTLAWGTKSTIATVGGTDITVTMPANPNTNTHHKAYLYATGSTGTAHASTTNGNTYLRLIENSEARSSIKVAGAGLTTVSSDGSGNITISTLNGTNAGDANTPVYLNGGTFTECTSLDLNTTGSAAKLAGGTTLTSATIDGFLEKNMVKWAPADPSAVGDNDGIIMSFGWSDVFGAQIWLDDGSGEGSMKIRNRGNGGESWNSWRQVLTEHNYNSYSPTLTGTGATGTWGISVSGNAATATVAASCSGNAATATTASACSGNAATATTASACSGNAATATKLAAAQTISLTGDVTGSASFTGNTACAITATVVDNSHNHSQMVNFTLGTGSTAPYIYNENGKLCFRVSPNGSSYNYTWINTDGSIQASKVYGAVWNDYAEYRESDCEDFGYVLMEVGDDSLTKTTERLSHFAGVSSDTWGFSQGETNKAKTPIAVAGRVLVYTYQDRNNYKPGDCVCAAPGGTVDIMTREEIREYPDRIVGTVSCIPDYEEWGGGEIADRKPIKVNNRIWIKVV